MSEKDIELTHLSFNNFEFPNSRILNILTFFFRFGRKNVRGRCWMSDPWSRRLSRKYQLRTIRQDGFGQQLNFKFSNSRILNILWIFPSCERKKKPNHSFKFMSVLNWKMGSHFPEGTLFSKLEIDKKQNMCRITYLFISIVMTALN